MTLIASAKWRLAVKVKIKHSVQLSVVCSNHLCAGRNQKLIDLPVCDLRRRYTAQSCGERSRFVRSFGHAL